METGTCPYPQGPCTGPGTIGGPGCDHGYLPRYREDQWISWTYHDCGDTACPADGTPLHVPADSSYVERTQMAAAFHAMPCPSRIAKEAVS